MKAHCHVASGGLTADQLARNWMIPLAKAQRTIEMRTTQRGIRTTRPDGLIQRFKTNDRMMFRYNRLMTTMYTDTLEANSTSHRKNKFAQIFAIPPAWVRAYAIKKKSDAHHTLGDLLGDIGAPKTLIMEGSKEQTLGLFRQKAQDASVKVKQTEPYTQKSNHAKAATRRELKKSVRRKMVRMRSPRLLWDDCLELEADIMSNTAHKGYIMQGQLPHAVITEHTSDISQIAEFGWYQGYGGSTNKSNSQIQERFLGNTSDRHETLGWPSCLPRS
jgi:hypothetical protein